MQDHSPDSEDPSPNDEHDSGLNTEANETGSEVSSSGLPAPLLAEEDYDALICRTCVLSNPTLRRWAGTEGVIMVVRNDVDKPWIPIGHSSEDIEVEVDRHSDSGVGGNSSESGAKQTSSAGSKRTLEHPITSGTSEGTQPKRPRTDSAGRTGGATSDPEFSASACTAPQQPKRALEVLAAVSSKSPNYDIGTGDVFLTDGWRARWCQCNEVRIEL